MTRLLAGAIAAIAAAAAIAANVLLLGNASASNDPVGRLNAGRVHLPPAPHWTVRPADGHAHDRHADD